LPFWTRLVLPSALSVIGTYLLVWSDHEAWPIGSLSFVQTFFGQDQEIIQHKFYGVFGATAAVSETLRRIGWAQHPAWAAPLLFFGLTGALLLFVHSHGNHPANGTIELHHVLLGGLGIGAAFSSAMVSWISSASRRSVKRWELAWAVFVILIGIQLLLYFE
jgi:putative copper resistance protein D